jgi:hypothetical protein
LGWGGYAVYLTEVRLTTSVWSALCCSTLRPARSSARFCTRDDEDLTHDLAPDARGRTATRDNAAVDDAILRLLPPPCGGHAGCAPPPGGKSVTRVPQVLALARWSAAGRVEQCIQSARRGLRTAVPLVALASRTFRSTGDGGMLATGVCESGGTLDGRVSRQPADGVTVGCDTPQRRQAAGAGRPTGCRMRQRRPGRTTPVAQRAAVGRTTHHRTRPRLSGGRSGPRKRRWRRPDADGVGPRTAWTSRLSC